MILEPKKIKSVTVSIVYPSICHEVMGPDAMILVLWMLSYFKSFLRKKWDIFIQGNKASRIRLKRLRMHECIGEGNGNPLQYSCLENPRDRGAWWAAICGVAQSQTRLKWLSSSSSNKASNPKVNTWIIFLVIHRYANWNEKFASPTEEPGGLQSMG